MKTKKKKMKLLLPAVASLLLCTTPLTIYADELLSVEPISSEAGETQEAEAGDSEKSFLDKKVWETFVELLPGNKEEDNAETKESFMNRPIVESAKDFFSGNKEEAASTTTNSPEVDSGTETAQPGEETSAPENTDESTDASSGTLSGTGTDAGDANTSSVSSESSETEEKKEITEENISGEITELDPMKYAKPFSPLTNEVDKEAKSMVASVYHFLSILAAAGLLSSVIFAAMKLIMLAVDKRPGSKEDILTELGSKVIVFGMFCSIALIGKIIGILVGIF